MSTNTANPVLAPIRRWVLYSRTNLTITIVSGFAVLFVAGSLFGQSPTAAKTASASNTTTTAATDAAVAGDLTYELTEVTESTIAGKSVAAVAESAPATAMTYAHIYVDRSLSNSEWKTKLGKHTAEAPGVTVVNARPLVAVAITGPTRSETVAGTGGESAVQVIVPTQAGNLRITLKATVSDKGSVWQVQSPLPTLDRSEVDKLGVPPLASAPPSKDQTTTSSPKSTTSSATTATTTQAPSTSTTAPSTSLEPAPVPVPGPIPIPDLDTPLPGTL
ncbi:hypothetical protein [Rhodococcus qingshengii]|uniref:Uncharacterized protein n=1 Tax=Rhodococcus qingshengii TaxID=334542 RepID=A0A2A5IZ72_RHOSG|nr:hypothetical protein [Rhodococcus qingshengii]PCK22279.1 hypothetical protein CHR55_32715 [Rhodococcus qingshengii]